MPLVFHMAHQNDWDVALAQKTGYLGSADDLRDGFIHMSTAQQIRPSAAKHRSGQTDLLLVAFESTSLGPALKWEPSRNGQLFPHYYGALDPSLARWIKPLPWDPTRQAHIFPDGFDTGDA